MEKKRIKTAMGQMLVAPGQVERNLERAVGMIRQAAAQHCEIIVLPECLDLGWTYPEARSLAEPIPGRYTDRLAEAAKEAKMYVVAGLTEKAGERLYNAAVLISSDGSILLKHRKINELSIAHDLYSIGSSLSAVETPFGIIGVNICADNSPDSLVLGHSLARMGAEIILSPCAWAVPSDHDNVSDPYGAMWEKSYGTLATLYDMPVIGVSNVGWVKGGEWDGWKCIGCSLAVAAEGTILTKGPYGDAAEELLIVEVDIQPRAEKGTQISSMLAEKGFRN